MASDEELQEFLRTNVFSFEELETLLFFARAARRTWSIPEVAHSVRLPEEVVEGALRALTSTSRLVEATAGTDQSRLYRLAAPDDALRSLDDLLRAYDERRVSVVRMMSSNALARLRSSVAQRLADAFRLDRGKK